MTSKRIAQTNQQQKSEKPQASGILQRVAVRSVADAGVQSADAKEVQPLSNSVISKDFSRVPISTTKPHQIMAKLTIGPVGDKYEREADRVAAQVVQRINAPAFVRSGEDETVQREEMETKDNKARLMRSPILQRGSSDGEMAAAPYIETSINKARSGGQPMADNIRQPMEKAFGANFSGVKVHTDAQSDQLNRSIQARAFTTGQDVFFRQGEYNPGSQGGQELIAHELTHVVQQNGGTVQRSQSTKHPLPSSALASNGGIGMVQRMDGEQKEKPSSITTIKELEEILAKTLGTTSEEKWYYTGGFAYYLLLNSLGVDEKDIPSYSDIDLVYEPESDEKVKTALTGHKSGDHPPVIDGHPISFQSGSCSGRIEIVEGHPIYKRNDLYQLGVGIRSELRERTLRKQIEQGENIENVENAKAELEKIQKRKSRAEKLAEKDPSVKFKTPFG
ncbi:eCIS core domain-containing protein [Nostoc sp.]|uniref:eCIS core domain-containing protein n=1 Tax=Nostoc sp. TaxID=1180 RepID=UPI002FFBF7D0